MKLFRSLGTVDRSACSAIFDTTGVELSSDNCVTNADVFDATTSEKNNGMLLEIVTDTRDVGSDFEAVCEANSGDLSDS